MCKRCNNLEDETIQIFENKRSHADMIATHIMEDSDEKHNI